MKKIDNLSKHYIYIIPIIVFLLGFVLTFLVSTFFPGDPILAYLPEGPVDPILYNQMRHELGYDLPLFARFFRFLGDFFTGNLGYSLTIQRGRSVLNLLLERIPLTIEFTIIPIALGLIAGIFLGVLSIKVRNRLVKLLTQFLIILGISMPMFLIGMWFQYTLGYQLELLPATGNPFLPSCILFLLTLFLTIRQVRSNYLKKPEEKHILANSSQIIFNLSVLFTSVILLESIFNIHGIFELFIVAIRNIDYWTFKAITSIIIVLLVIILLLSNIGYTIYNNILEKDQSIMFTNFFGRNEQIVEEAARYDPNTAQKFKDFTIYRLKSPITIIGLVIVAFTIIVAIFPQVLTPLSMQETFEIDIGAWYPPSATHPLGQTSFGRDVLALLAYGVSTSIYISLFSVLIGILVGSLFGYLCKVHRVVKELVLLFMVILFVVPCIIIIFIRQNMYGYDTGLTITTMAMYMIPGVTLIISKGPYSFKVIGKKLIAYFPLFMGFNILLLEALAFLGFYDPLLIHLGNNISVARTNLYLAPWASFWPGLALYVLVLGFISLHYGLKEPIPIAGRS